MDDGRPGPKRSVILLHGHGGAAIGAGLGWDPVNVGYTFDIVRALVEAGFACYGIDAGGPTSWGAPSAMTAIGNAVARVLARYGGTKVGILGASMGGLVALNHLKRNVGKVSGVYLVSPCTDLRWAYNEPGYVPGYSLAPAASLPTSYSSEIEAAFATNSAGYAAATAGYRVSDEASTWRGLSVPIRVLHSTSDPVVPFGQSLSFIAGVKDINVTMRTPSPTDNYHPDFLDIPPTEYVRFFAAAAWS